MTFISTKCNKAGVQPEPEIVYTHRWINDKYYAMIKKGKKLRSHARFGFLVARTHFSILRALFKALQTHWGQQHLCGKTVDHLSLLWHLLNYMINIKTQTLPELYIATTQLALYINILKYIPNIKPFNFITTVTRWELWNNFILYCKYGCNLNCSEF